MSFLKAGDCTESSFLEFGVGPGSGGSKRFGENRPFSVLARVRRSQTGTFLKAGLVQHRHV